MTTCYKEGTTTLGLSRPPQQHKKLASLSSSRRTGNLLDSHSQSLPLLSLTLRKKQNTEVYLSFSICLNVNVYILAFSPDFEFR